MFPHTLLSISIQSTKDSFNMKTVILVFAIATAIINIRISNGMGRLVRCVCPLSVQIKTIR